MAKRQRAKKMAAAGKSAAQIQKRTGVSAKAAQKFTSRGAPSAATNNSMRIKQDVIANPGKYDPGYTREAAAKDPTGVLYQGFYGSGLSDGEGGTYKLQGYHVPGATTGIGPDSDVLFAAGPNANQEWMNANFGPGGRYYGGDKQASGGTGGDSSSEPAAPTQDPAKLRGLGQGIRIAGGGGGIGKGELNTLMESGKNQGQIIRRLDKLNAKLKENGEGSINLKSGAANMLIRQANKNRTNLGGRRDFEFGTGRIGQQLGDMSGLSTSISRPNRMMAGGGWTPKGEEFTPEFLTRGIDLTGRGATGKTVRGVGKQYKGPNGKPDTTPGDDTGGGDTGSGDIGDIGTDIDSPINEAIEETNKGMSSGAGGLDLASWATGFKKAQSARQRAGRKAQGLASQKKTPFSSWKN